MGNHSTTKYYKLVILIILIYEIKDIILVTICNGTEIATNQL